MSDALGDRMKGYYEDRTRVLLPRRSNLIIRVDGKAFHTFTRGMTRPFDPLFMQMMDETAKALCEEVQGAKFGFVQSDEISVWATDYDTLQTDGWFGYDLRKICSVAASIATAAFNRQHALIQGPAMFDARAFTIPSLTEVVNYFVWRQNDATRNSVSMAAQSQFSHKDLNGVSCDQMQEKLFREKGINWNDYPVGFKRGRGIVRVGKIQDVEYVDKRTGEKKIQKNVLRSSWEAVDPPVFTKDRYFIPRLAPLTVRPAEPMGDMGVGGDGP